jgi:hypothetical protein
MITIVRLMPAVLMLFSSIFVTESNAGGSLQDCSVPASQASCGPTTAPRGPECGIEMTCAGGPIQLGYSSGVCFRASCPGVWGIVHERIDQASFRRRLLTYRHYTFRGYWDLKDQGVIESGVAPLRALFLLMPEDLIEFRLSDPDPSAKIELRELGYVKKGTVEELQRWLAYRVYMENTGESFSGREP